MQVQGVVKDLFEYQSKGLPMEQVLLLEKNDDGNKVPVVCAFFAAAEVGVFLVEFRKDGGIFIHVEGSHHIMTHPAQLQTICDLHVAAESLHEVLAGFIDDEGEFAGYQHLLTTPNTQT